MSESKPETYTLAAVDDSWAVAGKPCPQDLFVHMHSESRYLLFVARGEILTQHKVDTIRTLKGVNLYQIEGAKVPSPLGRQIFIDEVKATLKTLDLSKVYSGEALGAETERKIKDIYDDLLIGNHAIPAAEMSEALTQMSESLLAALVPEISDIKVNLLKHLSHISYMNYAAATTTMVLLVGMANDFKSRSTFRHLATACMLMDAGLGDLEAHWVDMYYVKREELPTHIWDRIRMHPLRSQQAIAYLPLATDLMNELILSHHELHNGRGYHRGISNGSTITLARVLALGVDMFEVLKGAELRRSPLTILETLALMRESTTEPHLRRHATRLIDNVYAYLGLKKDGSRAA